MAIMFDKAEVERLIRQQAVPDNANPVTEVVEFIDRHGRTVWGVTSAEDPVVYRESALVRKPRIFWPPPNAPQTR